MSEQVNKNILFSKGRRGADTLKLAYIIFAILLFATIFIHGGGPAILFFLLLATMATGPIWNIIDGVVDDGEQIKALQSDGQIENKLHALFNYVGLGFISTATLCMIVSVMATNLSAMLAGNAVVLGISLNLLIGPIGCSVFAVTMLWYASKSFREIEAYNDLINQNSQNHEILKQLKLDQYYVKVDCFAWATAGLGATGFAILAILAMVAIFPPAAVPITIGIFVLLSATTKGFQLYYQHPKPTLSSDHLKTGGTQNDLKTSHCLRQSSINIVNQPSNYDGNQKNANNPIEKAANK